MALRLVNAYIIDDEEGAVKLLKDMLEQNFSVSVCGSSNNMKTALEEIVEEEPDIVFLDVELNNSTSLDSYRQLKKVITPKTKIVFYTAFNKYMIDAIRHRAFDIVIKPVQLTDLTVVMNRYYEDKLTVIGRRTHNLEKDYPVILVTKEDGHLALKLDDIAYVSFNHDSHMWEIKCIDGAVHVLRYRTNADTILSYSPMFVQISKCCIVNINKVERIVGNDCYVVGMSKDDEALKINRNFKKEFMNLFYDM